MILQLFSIFNIFVYCLASEEKLNISALDSSISGRIPGRRRHFVLRIQNAHEADLGDFPFVGYIHYGLSYKCAGSIIHERWGVSAAHCILPGKEPQASFTVGTVNRDEGGTTYSIEKLLRHPSFVHSYDDEGTLTYKHDIGLFRMEENIVFTDAIKPIPLDNMYFENYKNKKVKVVGWGRPIGSENGKLQYFKADVLANTDCQTTWHFLRPEHLCTNPPAGGTVCPGDSGGPVVYNEILIAVLSYGPDDCNESKPTIHTKISPYLQWINVTLTEHGDTLRTS